MRKISPWRILLSLLTALIVTFVFATTHFNSIFFQPGDPEVIQPMDVKKTQARFSIKEDAVFYAPPPLVSNVLVNNNNGTILPNRFTQSNSTILAFGNNVLIAYTDAGSLTAAGNNHFVGFSYSSDGGTSFTDGGALPPSGIGDAGFPVLARNNTTGRIYLASLGFSTSLIQVFRSDNNGVNWIAPVVGTPGGSYQDKPWIAVDNNAGAGNGNVYLASRSFGAGGGLRYYRSVDHGNTYAPFGGVLLPAGPSANGPFITVGPNHHVYIFWYETGFIKMSRSTDLGLTFSPPINVASGLIGGVNGNMGLVGIRQGTATPAPFNSHQFPHAAVNPVSGHIYVTYANDGASTDKADVFLVQSIDGGLTWSAPQKVNDDLTSTDQWQPTVAVMPDGLNMGVFYYSRQEDGANNLFKYYMRPASINNTVLNFVASAPVSSVASFPEFGRDNVLNPGYMSISDQAVGTADGFAISWSDNRNDLTGGLPRKDPNVYFSLVGSGGPSPTASLSLFSTAFTGGNGDSFLDANETIDLTATLKNLGGATATGISAVLSSTSPGITITQNTSSYNDINSLATGDNLTDYVVTTSNEFACGNAEFTLTVTDASGSKEFSFSLPTAGVASAPMDFHNNTQTAITDNSFIELPLTVSGFTGVLGKVTLSLHLTHTFTGDLAISLISPGGETIDLSSSNGGAGDNYGSSCSGRTLFDDAAATTIISGAAPFVGTYKPEMPLSTFNGLAAVDVNGTWKLRIRDQATLDVGQFYCTTLSLYQVSCPSTIINSGATIVTESCSPGNGALDPSETVTVSLCLSNNGTTNTSNLVATLLNTGGITNAGSPQDYGELIAGGDPVCRNFTFTPTGNCGSTVTASLELQDGSTNLGVVTFSFTLGVTTVTTQTFSNTSSNAIPGSGTGASTGAPAGSYPSTISVSGLTGSISKLTVSLNGLNHTFPSDVDILLVAPTGQKMIILSDVGSGTDWVNTNYILDDLAPGIIPNSGAPPSGTYKPTNYTTGDVFPGPAPAAPYQSPGTAGSSTLASTFNGLAGNGVWNLYIVDDAGVDIGSLSGGWALNITTSSTSCCIVSTCNITCPADIEVPNDPGVCGAIVNYPAPQSTGDCGTIVTTPASGSLFPFGTTQVTATGSNGGSCTFNVTVVPADPSDCAISGATTICNGETAQWCAPEGMSDYEWTGPDQFKVFTRCATITEPGLYTVAFTDINGCRKQCSQELEVQNCPVACTYSQGFYGNKKGMACYSLNGVTSTVSTTQLMINAFGLSSSKVFGSVTNKQFFTLYKTDITNGNIFKMLPGNGNSLALEVDNVSPYDGAYYSAQNTWYLVPIPTSGSQKGKINNQLLSQLMTLWFNTQTSAALGSISLAEDTLVTRSQTNCSSGIPTGAETKYGLPHDVVVYLNGGNGYSNDVYGLYELANDVLGGENADLPAASVQKAVATINNAFDGCRVLVRTIPYDPLASVAPEVIVVSNIPLLQSFSLKAYPNPATSAFRLKVTSSREGIAQLSISNVLGQVIERRQILTNQDVLMGENYSPGTYIVQVVKDGETRQLKVVKLKN